MERNTFAASAYIAAPYQRIVNYLADLKNLDEWTPASRMERQVGVSTWTGTASGSGRPLYYHVKRTSHGSFHVVEWQCGLERGAYHQVQPVLVFPARYADLAEREPGGYLHWVSFVDPYRRTPMIASGMLTAHGPDCRALKTVLERGAGRLWPARGRHVMQSETIHVDAPVDVSAEYLGDIRSMTEYAFLLHPDGAIHPDQGSFTDDRGRRLMMRSRVHAMGETVLVEHEAAYPDDGFVQRSVTLLVPCWYAFGLPQARGFIKHRVAFWPADESRPRGRSYIDLRAESVRVKRLLEARAANLATG